MVWGDIMTSFWPMCVITSAIARFIPIFKLEYFCNAKTYTGEILIWCHIDGVLSEKPQNTHNLNCLFFNGCLGWKFKNCWNDWSTQRPLWTDQKTTSIPQTACMWCQRKRDRLMDGRRAKVSLYVALLRLCHKNGRPGLLLPETFSTSLHCSCRTDFDETWQESSTQHPLPVFFGLGEKNGRPANLLGLDMFDC